MMSKGFPGLSECFYLLKTTPTTMNLHGKKKKKIKKNYIATNSLTTII